MFVADWWLRIVFYLPQSGDFKFVIASFFIDSKLMYAIATFQYQYSC